MMENLLNTFIFHEFGASLFDEPPQTINPNEPTPVSASSINEDDMEYHDKVYTDLSNSAHEVNGFVGQYLDFSKPDEPERSETQSQPEIVHIKETPQFHSCHECPTQFSRINNLIKHYKKYHSSKADHILKLEERQAYNQPKELLRNTSNDIFHDKAILKAHRKNVHIPSHVNSCHICDQNYKTRTILLKHIKSIHKMTALDYYSLKNGTNGQIDLSKIPMPKKRCKPKIPDNTNEVKRKRGRPRKNPQDEKLQRPIRPKPEKVQRPIRPKPEKVPGVQRKRGRPRKHPLVVSPISQKVETIKTTSGMMTIKRMPILQLRRIDEGKVVKKVAQSVTRVEKDSREMPPIAHKSLVAPTMVKKDDNLNGRHATKPKIVAIESPSKITPESGPRMMPRVSPGIKTVEKETNTEPFYKSPKTSPIKSKIKSKEAQSKWKVNAHVKKPTAPKKTILASKARQSCRKIKPVKMSEFIYTLRHGKGKNLRLENKDTNSALDQNGNDIPTEAKSETEEKLDVPKSSNENEHERGSESVTTKKETTVQEAESETQKPVFEKMVINRVRKRKLFPDFVYDLVRIHSNITPPKSSVVLNTKETIQGTTDESDPNLKPSVVDVVVAKNCVVHNSQEPRERVIPSPTRMTTRNASKNLVINKTVSSSSGSAIPEESEKVERVILKTMSLTESKTQTENAENLPKMVQSTPKFRLALPQTHQDLIKPNPQETILHPPKRVRFDETIQSPSKIKTSSRILTRTLAKQSNLSVTSPKNISESFVVEETKLAIESDANTDKSEDSEINQLSQDKSEIISASKGPKLDKSPVPSRIHLRRTPRPTKRMIEFKENKDLYASDEKIPKKGKNAKTQSKKLSLHSQVNDSSATQVSINSTNTDTKEMKKKVKHRIPKLNLQASASNIEEIAKVPSPKSPATTPEFAKKSDTDHFSFYYEKKIVKPMSIIINKLEQNVFDKMSKNILS